MAVQVEGKEETSTTFSAGKEIEDDEQDFQNEGGAENEASNPDLAAIALRLKNPVPLRNKRG